MKLTDEQRKFVEENHNLIYSFISFRGLELDKWYGFLAEVLCKFTKEYFESGKDYGASFSTLFYRKAYWEMYKHERDRTVQKRKHNGHIELTDYIEEGAIGDNYAELISIMDMVERDETGILKMKLEGYTQSQIAEELGMTQPTVSRIINSYRKEYFHDR